MRELSRSRDEATLHSARKRPAWRRVMAQPAQAAIPLKMTMPTNGPQKESGASSSPPARMRIPAIPAAPTARSGVSLPRRRKSRRSSGQRKIEANITIGKMVVIVIHRVKPAASTLSRAGWNPSRQRSRRRPKMPPTRRTSASPAPPARSRSPRLTSTIVITSATGANPHRIGFATAALRSSRQSWRASARGRAASSWSGSDLT